MSAQRTTSAKAQILVIESSSVFGEMQALLLRQAGYGVGLFDNPHAALDAAVRQRFDFVLIDHELPNVKAEQLMHALRALQPEIAVAFASGSLTPELISKLSRHRVAGIFSKPVSPTLLVEKIAQALNHDDHCPVAAGTAAAPSSFFGGNAPRGFDSIAIWAASASPFAHPDSSHHATTTTEAPVRRPAPRSGTNPPMLATKSIFRPASKNYHFGKRLAESIAHADVPVGI